MTPTTFKFPSASTQVYFHARFSDLKKLAGKARTILVTDENVYAAHTAAFAKWDVIVLKPGEEYKIQETVTAVIRQLLEMEADRSTLLVGVGGGVITDLTGYIASVYLRGIRFGFVPTSLLAMVDAAIGGKNGVDLDDYKNIAGTFRQPAFLLYDKNFLRSLPEPEWRNGMAEVIKHACLQGRRHFEELEKSSLAHFQENAAALDALITGNARFKLRLVQKDEQEKDQRRLLNFGHTLGHALEKQYELSHGEAVAIGMQAACRFSEILLGFKEKDRVGRLLEQYGLPSGALFHPEKILHLLRSDKKRMGNVLHFVLLAGIGKPVIQPIPLRKLEKLLDRL